MVYVLTSEGSVLRAPLDHYARESAEVVANVFSPSYYTDCAIDTLSTGFAVVVCYNQTKQNVISLRIANCEAAATADACLSDPHYCTWYLYGQSCQLRTYAARVLCAGANATHCTTTVPSIGAVVPGAGYGGTAVNITVGTLWQDASLRCVFGVNASAVATYDAATEVVSCTAPPGNVGTVIVNVRYLAEDIVPISAATFTYVAECTVPDDCTVVHGAAGECRTWRCDVADGKCTADPAAAATPCTAVAGDGCVLGPAPNGTAADGLCTGTGECVVRAAAVAVPLCEEASLAYVDGAHAMALGGIGEACTTDADCGDGLALGCAAVGCLPGTGQCGVVWMADGSPCTPTAADEPPCTQAQLGMCESGRCVVAGTENATAYCAIDPLCAGARCFVNGTCVELTDGDLTCTVEIPACGSPPAVCNGRGQCVFGLNASCIGATPCTLYGCDVSTGACTVAVSPAAECAAPSFPAAAAAVYGCVLLVLAFAATSVMLWLKTGTHTKPF
jgi:hypothetical protein